MDHPRRILVVAKDPRVADRVLGWLADGPVTLVETFSSAKAHLSQAPDLIITELKLGEYNGLHLALKAQTAGIPAIVIGPPDPVLQRDAEGFQAVYLAVLTHAALLDAIAKALASSSSMGMSPRLTIPVTTIAAEADAVWHALSDPDAALLAWRRRLLPN